MATLLDQKVAGLVGGFALGFGFLTVWEAIKQTRRSKNPRRSVYIYMVWGEIAANVAIWVIGWLFHDGILKPTLPTLFTILVLWVFEIQLLLQIIINRISLIAERRHTVRRLKWGVAALITAINISVFCIWIPAHMDPPASPYYFLLNEYWDRIEKGLILIVDALLNLYFLRTVNRRLVKQHGLTKYKPLVTFNAKIMIVSISMDAMLIGILSMPDQIIYILFHPVAYMVKLNIEMAMASLVVRLARGKREDDRYDMHSTKVGVLHLSDMSSGSRYPANSVEISGGGQMQSGQKQSGQNNEAIGSMGWNESGIMRRTDYNVTVESIRGLNASMGEEMAAHKDGQSSPDVTDMRDWSDEDLDSPHFDSHTRKWSDVEVQKPEAAFTRSSLW